MNAFGYSPTDYFNRWLAEPIRSSPNDCVESVLDALNAHPIAQDETAQDYIMPRRRYRERQDRFRIFGENQDTFYCYVKAGAELLPDPPVYFETCLDLRRDCGFSDIEIIDGDSLLLCEGFQRFLWHMLGQQICIRLEGNGLYAAGVHGMVFSEPVKLDATFANPLGCEFPAGYTCYVSESVLCVPDWGAAFLDVENERQFCDQFRPKIASRWDEKRNSPVIPFPPTD